MKLALATAVMIGVLASPAAAACNSEMLAVVDWKATKNDSTLLPYLLEATVRYEGARPYRMIHAGVMFADVLGEQLGQVNLPKDAEVSPGAVVVADAYVDADERLGVVNRDDIVYRTCVWSIVYDDGTVEKFD
jgi:hypothetical protein